MQHECLSIYYKSIDSIDGVIKLFLTRVMVDQSLKYSNCMRVNSIFVRVSKVICDQGVWCRQVAATRPSTAGNQSSIVPTLLPAPGLDTGTNTDHNTAAETRQLTQIMLSYRENIFQAA